MADYLTDLAVGLSESTGVLRPRQASRFEPASQEDQIPTFRQPLEQAEDTDSPRAQGASGEPPPRAARPAMSHADPSAFAQLPGQPDIPALNARRHPVAERTLTDVPSPVDPRDPSRESPHVALGSEAPFSVRDMSLRQPTEPRAEIEAEGALIPAPSPPPTERTRPVEPRPSGPIERPAFELPVDAATVKRPAIDPAAEAANSIFRPPPLSPRLPRERPSQSEHRAEQPPEPTIHVTIGRVEVRATSEAEPRARRKEEAAPVMTLDEYLRKRGSR
jgi:hypothetical protein